MHLRDKPYHGSGSAGLSGRFPDLLGTAAKVQVPGERSQRDPCSSESRKNKIERRKTRTKGDKSNSRQVSADRTTLQGWTGDNALALQDLTPADVPNIISRFQAVHLILAFQYIPEVPHIEQPFAAK